MIKIEGFNKGIWLTEQYRFAEESAAGKPQQLTLDVVSDKLDVAQGRMGTMAYQIMKAHGTESRGRWELTFDALASHDITYVGIIQTARAAGLDRFPVPYVLTNCHNSLCAVGGTINEDDHVFGLSAAKKYGGIFVPAHAGVIHQYVREMLAAPGKMILGSDSHTRYGFLGTLGVGEGGPELVRQLLGLTYSLAAPRVIAVYLTGKPRPGVGPQDVALALIKAVFDQGLVKNAVLEFMGPGVESLSAEYRAGIDVMTTETACLSSVWITDEVVRNYLAVHGREEEFREIRPIPPAYYDGLIRIDLSAVPAMIALPFHPSNAWPIEEVNSRPSAFLAGIEEEARKQVGEKAFRFDLVGKVRDGRLLVDQGVIAGCSGGMFENIRAAAEILSTAGGGKQLPADFNLSIYPASLAIQTSLIETGLAAKLLKVGAVLRSAFCGPCFGAGDVPSHGSLSIRHTTRNFPFREGSKPGEGQLAAVALMDSRSIAATAANGGKLTAATELLDKKKRGRQGQPVYFFDSGVYQNRVYNGYNRPQADEPLRLGPNIRDWPAMLPMPENLLIRLCAVIRDPVTTTDELIPSGETSSFRSNPYKLAEFTLSRRCPDYVKEAKAVQELELIRRRLVAREEPGNQLRQEELLSLMENVRHLCHSALEAQQFISATGIGSAIFAVRPGDGSAREQAASCQKVLGGWANLAHEYATKRYRSNVVNWGMLPFTISPDDSAQLEMGMWLYIPGIRKAVAEGGEEVTACLLSQPSEVRSLKLYISDTSAEERRTLLAGGLIGYLKEQKEAKEQEQKI